MSPRARPRAKIRDVNGDLTEAAFQKRVVGLARAYGWRIFHAPDNRPAGPRNTVQATVGSEAIGFPDLVLVKPPRIVFAELKKRTGRLGPGQREWLDLFREVGLRIDTFVEEAGDVDGITPPKVESHLWRPADWVAIQHVLRDGQEYRYDLDPVAEDMR